MSTRFPFSGTCTALVTPFDLEGRVDYKALVRLLDMQVDGGVEAVLLLGTTGENPTVSLDERRRTIDTALSRIGDRLPVIVGTGTNDTAATVVLGRQAERAGAYGQLVVGPFYNKPTQAGFRAHVHALADATDLPMILYSVPGRTGFEIETETILRLASDVPAVRGIKEAGGRIQKMSDLLAGRTNRLAIYAGDDELAAPLGLMGGDGVISVISNAIPGLFSTMVRAAIAGDRSETMRLQAMLLPAMRACFFETNPIPIKSVLADMGMIEEMLRLPLQPISALQRPRVQAAFESLLHPVEEVYA